MSTTTLENPPRIADNEDQPRRLNLDPAYINKVMASFDQGFSHSERPTASPEVVTTSTVGAPAEGFPSTSEIEQEYEELGPIRFSLRQGISYNLGLGLIKTQSYLSNRALKKKIKFDAMSAKEQIAHVEKTGRFANIAALGTVALYAVLKTHAIDHLMTAIDEHAETARRTVEDHGQIRKANYTASLDPEGQHQVSAADMMLHNTEHDPKNVANFHWDYNHDPARQSSGKEGNDFGTALVESPDDIKFQQPAGMRDLLNRWMDSPKEFATVMSKFGIIPNNPESINKAAEIMADPQQGPKLYQDAYKEVIEKLAASKIEIKDITGPYGSYYVVDKNGVLTIAYDDYVGKKANEPWGTMFVITTPDGKIICLRRECGGQPIDMLPQQVPASPEVQQYAAAQNQPAYVEKSLPPETHDVPVSNTPENTPTGNTPTGDTPNTPNGGTPDTPPPEEEHKGNDYIKDPNVVQRGENKFEPTPAKVDTTITNPGMPGIDQPPLIDNHKRTPSSETGGAAPDKTAPSLGTPGASENAGGGSSAEKPKTGTAAGPQ